jgi:NAD(P)-dependent dehydrogenase (short-subunit alcohol dehydrogenase family)
MGDAQEVCALASTVLSRNESVHVLIHSAGGLQSAAARTRKGVDRGFAQNFLGASCSRASWRNACSPARQPG